MWTSLRSLWNRIDTSYWFVPAVFGTLGLTLSVVLGNWEDFPTDLPVVRWFGVSQDLAQLILATIAGATVTVMGTAFSVVVVVLTLASQQFGPRLPRTFMKDTVSQFTLGIFFGTSVYCLFSLQSLGRGSPVEGVVLCALLLVFGCLVMLVYLVHHVANLIQSPMVIARVCADADEAIRILYPGGFGREIRSARLPDERETWSVESPREGYIQTVNGEVLLSLAERHRLIVEVPILPGDFVPQGSTVFRVWGGSPQPAIERLLLNALEIDILRTPVQDLNCALDELVEVAVRALSPAMNDPFTACNCVDRLGTLLVRFGNRVQPCGFRAGADGELRLVLRTLAFEPLWDRAFRTIRHSGAGSFDVNCRLLDAHLYAVLKLGNPDHRAYVVKHAERVMKGAWNFPPEDLALLRRKLASLHQIAAAPAGEGRRRAGGF